MNVEWLYGIPLLHIARALLSCVRPTKKNGNSKMKRKSSCLMSTMMRWFRWMCWYMVWHGRERGIYTSLSELFLADASHTRLANCEDRYWYNSSLYCIILSLCAKWIPTWWFCRSQVRGTRQWNNLNRTQQINSEFRCNFGVGVLEVFHHYHSIRRWEFIFAVVLLPVTSTRESSHTLL